jgi:hypothetical protein
MKDISYYDIFSDSSETLHANMFGLYKWDIAPVATLVTLQ